MPSYRKVPQISHPSSEFKKLNFSFSLGPLSDLEKNLKLKEEYLYKTSVELKDPLSKLQDYISVTLKAQKNGRITSEELHHRLLNAENKCSDLAEVVNDLIELSSGSLMNELKVSLSEVNLCNVAAEVVERFLDQSIEESCQIILDCPEPVVAKLDEKRIDQVITHLLTNALKFAPGLIKVKLYQHFDVVTLEVSDHGPGIPFSKQASVFDRFTKLCDSSDGFGVGLWLVRNIVERFNGTISLLSVPGEGSVFTIKIPTEKMLH